MTLREVVFMCIDEAKLNSDDSIFTEDHVIYLLGRYRSYVLKAKLAKASEQLSTANSQTICLDLIQVRDEDNPCGETILRTEQKIPDLVYEGNATVFPANYFEMDRIIYTSMERLRFVTYNKWTRDLIYAAKGPDGYLYLRSDNPQYLYLEKIRMKGIFDDFEKAAEYACDDSGESVVCDVLDSEFPLESALIPVVADMVVKELVGYKWQMRDLTNNASDDSSTVPPSTGKKTKKKTDDDDDDTTTQQ